MRNIRPGFRCGLWAGLLYAALDTYLLRGRAPWTLRNHADHTSLRPAAKSRKIDYPAPDGVISFDRMSSVYLSNTNHEEDQPCHLTLKDASVPVAFNLPEYAAPEQRYCPAGVYEIVEEAGGGAIADQRAELRPLQGLRHQGSDAEHRLDHPRRRRRAELSEYVAHFKICDFEVPNTECANAGKARAARISFW